MRLVRYNPFNEVFRNPFNDFFTDPICKPTEAENGYPPVDILSESDHVVVNVELPGVQKEDININIEEKILTISGNRKKEEAKDGFYLKERFYGSFKRIFTLSDDILTDEVNADLTDGVLKITLQKKQVKDPVKQVAIN